jgi:hypothetical protein
MTRFDVGNAEGDLPTESPDQNERMEADIETEARAPEHTPEPISDNEEGDDADSLPESHESLEGYGSRHTQHDQDDKEAEPEKDAEHDKDTEHGDEDDGNSTNPPLPSMGVISSQPLHRQPKRRRNEDEYLYAKKRK